MPDWFYHELSKGVTMVRVLNRRLPRFENFWPIPRGTSYNFYLVEGDEGVAVIDGVDYRFTKEFFEALDELVDYDRIRYVVTQHTEPDHSGTLAELLKRAEKAQLLGTMHALMIGEKLANLPKSRAKQVKEGEEISLGGKTLRFHPTPMVHWPDTLMTYLVEDSILFTCDLFGSHGASEKVFYDEAPEEFELADYYSSVLMVYDKMVAKAVDKVRAISPKVIAPAHGALHRDLSILDVYQDWANWKPKKRAFILVGSQYENTAKAAEAAAEELRGMGFQVDLVDSAEVMWDDALTMTIESGLILLATSTHNGKPFPGISFYLDLLEEFKPRNRVFAVMGSYGWGGGASRYVKKKLESMGVEVKGVFDFKGAADEEVLRKAREFARQMGEEVLKLL